ncbi:MAG: hypothetical protein WBG50_03520 [Desulfomonilaceae bacterium]
MKKSLTVKSFLARAGGGTLAWRQARYRAVTTIQGLAKAYRKWLPLYFAKSIFREGTKRGIGTKALATLGVPDTPYLISDKQTAVLGSPIKRPCFLRQKIAACMGFHYSTVIRIVQREREKNKKQDLTPSSCRCQPVISGVLFLDVLAFALSGSTHYGVIESHMSRYLFDLLPQNTRPDPRPPAIYLPHSIVI